MGILADMPHTVTTRTKTRVKGSMGGHKSSPTTIATGVEAWVQPAGAREIAEYERRGIAVTNKVYFTEDPGLDENDEIVYDGRIFDVRATMPDASAGTGTVYKVMVEYISFTGAEE